MKSVYHAEGFGTGSAKVVCTTGVPTKLDYHLALQAHGAQAHTAQMAGSYPFVGIDP